MCPSPLSLLFILIFISTHNDADIRGLSIVCFTLWVCRIYRLLSLCCFGLNICECQSAALWVTDFAEETHNTRKRYVTRYKINCLVVVLDAFDCFHDPVSVSNVSL